MQQFALKSERGDILSWLPQRRACMEHTDAEAEALIHDFGAAAYCEARQRQHDASDDAIAKYWDRVALAIARKVGKRLGVDASTRMAMNAVLVPDREPVRVPTSQIIRGT
jgi:hypothetical protein